MTKKTKSSTKKTVAKKISPKKSVKTIKKPSSEWEQVERGGAAKGKKPSATLLLNQGMIRLNGAFIRTYFEGTKKVNLFVREGKVAIRKADDDSTDALCLTPQKTQAGAALISCKPLLTSIDIKTSDALKSIRASNITTDKVKGVVCPVLSFM